MHLKLLPSCQKIREEKKKKNKVICNILFVSILCIIAKEMLKKKINCNKVILVHGVSACVPGGAGGWGPHRYGPFWGWGPSPCTAAGSLQHPAAILAAMATGGGLALLCCRDSGGCNGDRGMGAGWRCSCAHYIRPLQPPPCIIERLRGGGGTPCHATVGERGVMFPNGGHSPAGIEHCSKPSPQPDIH